MRFEIGDEVIIVGPCTLGYYDDNVDRTGIVEYSYIRIGDTIPDCYRVRFLDGDDGRFPPESLALWGVPDEDYMELFL